MYEYVHVDIHDHVYIAWIIILYAMLQAKKQLDVGGSPDNFSIVAPYMCIGMYLMWSQIAANYANTLTPCLD